MNEEGGLHNRLAKMWRLDILVLTKGAFSLNQGMTVACYILLILPSSKQTQYLLGLLLTTPKKKENKVMAHDQRNGI